MTKNNIKYITFTFKLYSLHFIETMNNNNNNKKNVYIYFNEKIIEWVDTILMPFIKKNNLNIIINYINIE
jgi:hypothetical protein